jgi:hypothetical protein
MKTTYVVGQAALLWLMLACGTASADVIIDVNGTPSNATITASVVGDDVFQTGPATGVIDFVLPPNAFAIEVRLEGPLGPSNPWILRAPADGSYMNLLRISSGDFSDFQLDKDNPITSSSMVVLGDIEDLAVLDGVTSLMTVDRGTGPDANVTLNYNVVDPVSVGEPALPTVFALRAAVPNPSRVGTRIAFDLPEESPVSLGVFDVAGRLVRTLLGESRPAGVHEVVWDGRDEQGKRVSPGVYIYRLETPEHRSAKKVLVVR